MIVLMVTACLAGAPQHCADFTVPTKFRTLNHCTLFSRNILLEEVKQPKFAKYTVKRVECGLVGEGERDA